MNIERYTISHEKHAPTVILLDMLSFIISHPLIVLVIYYTQVSYFDDLQSDLVDIRSMRDKTCGMQMREITRIHIEEVF